MYKTLIKPKKGILLIILNFVFTLSFSQFFLSPEEIYNEGVEFMLSEEYAEALPDFKHLLSKGYTSATIYYKMGMCYLNIPGQKENSIEYLEKAETKATSKYQGKLPEEDAAPLEVLFYLGEAYRINNQFEKCHDILLVFKDSVNDNPECIAKANYELKTCEHAKELIKAKIDLKVTKPDVINSGFSNYNPLVNSSESLIYYMEALKFYDAIMQAVVVDGNWSQPENLTSSLKSDGDYEVVDMSEDGNTLLLYLYDSYTKGDIYTCKKRDGKWDKIIKLNDNINTQFNETHASFANHDNTLYFTSNRRGGFGGLDIYKSEKDKDGDWGPAVNIGNVINTLHNEETPFISKDGKSLYFCSQGHFNMGGFDIFVSQLTGEGTWSYPSNIGYPLNTTDDDLFYYPLNDGLTGYHVKYSDNVSGTMDIYRYEILSRANPARFTVKGHISSVNENSVPFEKIKIALVDKTKNDTLDKKHADKDGGYMFKLPSGEFELNFYSAKNLYHEKKSIKLPDYLTVDELVVNTSLDTALLAEIDTTRQQQLLAEVNKNISISDTLIIHYILFGFDRYTLNKASLNYLAELMDMLKKYPEITISLNGYTDAIGAESYNKILSEQRANQVKKLMLSDNIPATRIDVKGLGEENPVALNTNPDGSDNAEGRKYNRRVEVLLTNVPDNLMIIFRSEIPEELRIK